MPYGIQVGNVPDQPEQPKHDDKMLDALSKAITEQLMQQAPQAPQAPEFRGLPGVQAAAAALNPQLTPTLIQKQMAPDMARYQTQQQAFEAAMQGRREAMVAGTSLVGRDITGQYAADRPSRATRPLVEKNVELKSDGQYHLVIRYKDPQNPNVLLAEDDRGAARQGYSYQYDQATGDVIQMPSSGPPMAGGEGGLPGRKTNIHRTGTPAEISQTGSAMSLMDQIGQFESGASDYSKSPQSFAGALAQQTYRQIPGDVGTTLSESKGDPRFEALATQRTKLSKTIAAMRESGKLSDQDVNWAAVEMPTIASLATEQGRQVFTNKLSIFKRELFNRMKRQAQLKPVNFTDDELKMLGLSGALPSPQSDPASELFREMYGRDPGGV